VYAEVLVRSKTAQDEAVEVDHRLDDAVLIDLCRTTQTISAIPSPRLD
jgi:hypothetical protein